MKTIRDAFTARYECAKCGAYETCELSEVDATAAEIESCGWTICEDDGELYCPECSAELENDAADEAENVAIRNTEYIRNQGGR